MRAGNPNRKQATLFSGSLHSFNPIQNNTMQNTHTLSDSLKAAPSNTPATA